MKIDIFNTDNEYGIIYTDPPWMQTKGGLRKARPNQNRTLDYPTLSIDEIMDIHCYVGEMLTDDNFNVFMWTIDKFLPETEQMMSEMGYELHARIIWDKTNGIAPAFTVRYSHEYLLWFYKKGHILMPVKEVRGRYSTVIREPSTVHSKKPVAAYEMIEAMFPDIPKLELFAREHRNGWDCWGNEC